MTFRLAHRCELIWALPAINSREQVHALLSGGDLIVVGTPTYGQGSPWFVRKFFELSTGCSIWGKPATAFATSGGEHTGGEFAVGDTLRSLQGMGACTFSFAQKTLVFGTNQKFLADGHFDLIDIWFMRQFARTVLLHAITRDNPDDTSAWAARLGLETDYYNRFPGEAQLQDLPPGMGVETLGADFDAGPDAFLDTAAVMKCCDLVITSDTAVAHLAGALGVKTWVALKHVPDWRWFLDRDDSPWYPSMRLFRQEFPGDWDGVFANMKAALTATPSVRESGSIPSVHLMSKASEET